MNDLWEEVLNNSAYEVRVTPRIRVVTTVFVAVALFFDVLGIWGTVKNWDIYPRSVGELALVALVINVPALLAAALTEYYAYRVRLFVLVPEREYVYRPLIGELRYFTVFDIDRVELGGNLLVELFHGHSMVIYGIEKRIICRLDMNMVNIIRLSDELRRALRAKPFNVHYTDGQMDNMRRAERTFNCLSRRRHPGSRPASAHGSVAHTGRRNRPACETAGDRYDKKLLFRTIYSF